MTTTQEKTMEKNQKYNRNKKQKQNNHKSRYNT